MEDTVAAGQSFPYKSLPMRVTHKEVDYTVYLLQKTIEKGTREVRVLVDGKVHTLIRTGTNHWRFAEIADNAEFAQSIWNAISLRYRL